MGKANTQQKGSISSDLEKYLNGSKQDDQALKQVSDEGIDAHSSNKASNDKSEGGSPNVIVNIDNNNVGSKATENVSGMAHGSLNSNVEDVGQLQVIGPAPITGVVVDPSFAKRVMKSGIDSNIDPILLFSLRYASLNGYHINSLNASQNLVLEKANSDDFQSEFSEYLSKWGK